MLWESFVSVIQSVLFTTAQCCNGSLGLGILIVSVVFRLLFLPLNWKIAKMMAFRSEKLREIRPQLESIRKKYRNDPRTSMNKTFELLRSHNVQGFSWLNLLGFLQVPFVLAIMSVVKKVEVSFLWIKNIARPDFILAFAIGTISYLLVLLSPEMQHKEVLATLLTIVTVVSMSYVAAGFALYVFVASCFSFAEKLVLQRVINKRES
ncbi:YidC/Oxa1 family membrane protein insertase [Candidatus Uabimicrobium sp. HlEnr_7]|uniref:YidC/Oxa1 family membrane protein insertase n=1 Tax=Candidatus Uabimicrobium helgolandensis TaxID=3095367 RepID=UPI00355680E8